METILKARDYQEKAHEAIRTALNNGIKHQLLQMATGTGKTIVFAELPDRLRDILPGKMLVLAHREELIDQAITKMQAANPSLRIDKEMADHRADPNRADVIVASVGTLGRKGTKRLDAYDWSLFDKFVVDEAHHSVAQSYMNVFEAAGLLNPGDERLLLGVTATPQRGDGQALAKLYRKIVYAYPIRKAIEEGWLVEPRGFRILTGTSLDGVKVVRGDYEQQQLANAVNTPERNQLIVAHWGKYAQDRQTVGFTVDIRHAKDLAAMFQHYGIKAEAVWGDDPLRAAKLQRHRNRQTTVLFNCGVLTEGYDDWQIGCIILAAPTKSPVKFAQMVGRGTRLEEGTGNLNEVKTHWHYINAGRFGKSYPFKTDCIVLDVVDSSTKNSLVTLPTLMGMSARLDIQGRGVVQSVKELEAAQQEYPHIDFSRLESIDQIQTHIENVNLFDFKFPADVEKNSQLSWHIGTTGGYVLLLPEKDSLSIWQNLLDKWEIVGNIKGNKYRGERNTIEDAFAAADDLIFKTSPEALTILRREERWHEEPATPAQLGLLSKLFKGKAIPRTITKGTASRLISSCLAKKG